MLKKLSLLLACALAMASCGPSISVYDLTCEGLTDPLAIDSAEPHFSWKISSDVPVSQVAYQIQVSSSLKDLKSGKAGLWDSGRVVSLDQVMIPYSGTNLGSRQQCWWRVRVWKSDKEVSKWSSPRRFGIGIIGEDLMSGEYIGAAAGDLRSPLLRKSFDLHLRERIGWRVTGLRGGRSGNRSSRPGRSVHPKPSGPRSGDPPRRRPSCRRR